MRKLTIATRKSPLALWQAHHVSALLRAKGVEVALLEMTTAGDRFLQAPLAAVGGKGLFVKEIEQSLLERRADVAVHSLKDMTSEMPAGLTLACVPDREDPRDAFVGRKVKTLAELPRGARVGTSSLRRASQLLEKRPDLEIVPLRGNVQSRLRKTEELDLHGTILAYAGLKRLGLDSHATEVIAPEVSLPAVGQGALGIQCRVDDAEVLELLRSLQHKDTRIAVSAERAFLEVLQGGCTVPLAGYATIEAHTLHLRGLVGSPDGKRVVRGERRGPVDSAVELGRSLADEILGRGGREILDAHSHTPKPPPVEMT